MPRKLQWFGHRKNPTVQHAALANNVQNAYNAYINNIDTLEYYRKNILPDQVQAYRGVVLRRQADPNAQFGDLVAAQQTLATSVSSYLNTLGQLWSSTIALADFLQTDDLFSLANPQAIPQLPDFASMPAFPCTHPVRQPGPGESKRPIPRMSEEPLGPVEKQPIPVAGPKLIRNLMRQDETEEESQQPVSKFRLVE